MLSVLVACAIAVVMFGCGETGDERHLDIEGEVEPTFYLGIPGAKSCGFGRIITSKSECIEAFDSGELSYVGDFGFVGDEPLNDISMSTQVEDNKVCYVGSGGKVKADGKQGGQAQFVCRKARDADKVPCISGEQVFITSHRNENLKDDKGKVALTRNAGGWEKWTLMRVSDGMSDGTYFISSHRNEQLEDRSDKVKMRNDLGGYQKWFISDAGDADKVFIRSHRNQNLQDKKGDVKVDHNTGGWEKWKITRMNGESACPSRGLKSMVRLSVSGIRSFKTFLNGDYVYEGKLANGASHYKHINGPHLFWDPSCSEQSEARWIFSVQRPDPSRLDGLLPLVNENKCSYSGAKTSPVKSLVPLGTQTWRMGCDGGCDGDEFTDVSVTIEYRCPNDVNDCPEDFECVAGTCVSRD